MQPTFSFGYWVRRRRKMLDMTQAELATTAHCSLSMVRKIERDERRPSAELAQPLADALKLGASDRQPFLRMTRGRFVPELVPPIRTDGDPPSAAAGWQDARADEIHVVGRASELQWLHEQRDKAPTAARGP